MLQPDPLGPRRIAEELTALFASLRYVFSVQTFGSLARDDWDRWSDIDLLLVTASRAQFRAAFDHLCEQKSVVYHAPFAPRVEPSGGRVLGITFEGESVFHSLDLNFLTAGEARTIKAWERFTPNKTVYTAAHTVTQMPGEKEPEPDPEENLVERRITTAQHFTKVHAKRILRNKHPDRYELQRWSDDLRTALQAPGVEDLGEGVRRLGRSYLEIAEAVLADDNKDNLIKLDLLNN